MKIALVTGVTSGFGLAIAKRLIKEGYHVIGAGRKGDVLATLSKELGEAFTPLVFDVRSLTELENAFNSLPNTLKNIDLLVNNAGLALGLEPAHQANLEDWDTMVDTNVKGLINMTRVVLPYMVARNTGHVINIGSIAGTYPYPGGNVYGATKAFVRQFSLNLRADLAGTRIRVSNIEPGLCGDTNFSLTRFKGDSDKAKQLYENVQYVTPEDIANTVCWINAQPEHMNVNSIEIMPTAQTFAPLKVVKDD